MPEMPFTVMGCATEGQRIAADRLRERPGYVLRGYRCEVGRREERPA